MSYVTIEDRVDRLEALFGQFMTGMALANKRAEQREKLAEERNALAEARNRQAEERFARFEREMLGFKNEMTGFKDEMSRFKDEMLEFKNEMLEFKNEMRQARKDLDKKWGDLANKMGTIIEDILAPNLRRLARDHFRFQQIDDFIVRCYRRRRVPPGVESEFDTLVVGPEAVILGEAKSTPALPHADELAEKARAFFDFFPEYSGKRLIAVLGSWAMPDPVVDRLTALRLYAMRMGEETMELANAAALEKGAKP